MAAQQLPQYNSQILTSQSIGGMNQSMGFETIVIDDVPESTVKIDETSVAQMSKVNDPQWKDQLGEVENTFSAVQTKPTPELPQITDNDLQMLNVSLIEPPVNSNQLGNAQENITSLLVTFMQEKGVQTDPQQDALNILWPPKIPVASYLTVPFFHHFLWQTLIHDGQTTVTTFLNNLKLVPKSVHDKYSIVKDSWNGRKIRDFVGYVFNANR